MLSRSYSLSLLALAPALFSQTPNPAMTFEAASIRPLKQSEGRFHFTVFPNRLDVGNQNLKSLIEYAWDLPDFQITGPASIEDHTFDIVATTGVPVSASDMQTMLRNLLAERFHLATHWQTRTEPLYRPVVLPDGSKMKPAAEGYASPSSPMLDGNSLWLKGPMSMRQLTEVLTRYAGKPVMNATNLEGYFNVGLNFDAGDVMAPPAGDAPAQPLPKAIEQQLGLKLVEDREAIKILVVDRADREPVAN